MIEANKFKIVDTILLYDDWIGKVSLYDASYANESEEQRIWTVSTLAGIAYGNEEAKNPEALYERLKELKHESLWEFIRSGEAYDYGIEGSMRNQSYYHFPDEDVWNKVNHQQNIACFRIKVPIFVARQFMRHRSFSYIEMSRRYTKDSKVPFEFWFPNNFGELSETLGSKENFIEAFNYMYNGLSEKGLHTQVASRFLPQTTYTEFYMMGEVEGLKNFFRLRLDPHAQEEIRECATAMLELLKRHQGTLYEKVK